VTVFNDGDAEIEGNLTMYLTLSQGARAQIRTDYDRGFGGLVGSATSAIGKWHFAFGAVGESVRHMITTGEERPARLPASAEDPAQEVESDSGAVRRAGACPP